MEIKRNIFSSRGRMPKNYEAVSSALTKDSADVQELNVYGKLDANVRHAPIPRIGEQR